MTNSTLEMNRELKVSRIAENIIGSEIIKLAAEVNEKIKQGEKIYNLTIGDFNPKLFPIPFELKKFIVEAYEADETNYPSAEGMIELRKVVATHLKNKLNLDYTTDEIIIAAGARPLIYGTYRSLIDAGDTVVFPVPSWNNNHYAYLQDAKAVFVETSADDNFMPTAESIKPLLKNATMVALCSPQNPTGTIFTKKQLEDICDLVLEENNRRGENEKPLYLMYDQIYWELTLGDTTHYNPVSLRPEMKKYTVFIDGISKSLAATGVRVGWAFGPKKVMSKMKSILGHMGAWAPRAEQMATAKYIASPGLVDSFMNEMKNKVNERLQGFYKGFSELKKLGYKVNVIAPQAAIYLTVSFDLLGSKTQSGSILKTPKDVTAYLLNEAKIAIVPFYAFGASETSTWFRLSVGTCKTDDIPAIIDNVKKALQKLS